MALNIINRGPLGNKNFNPLQDILIKYGNKSTFENLQIDGVKDVYSIYIEPNNGWILSFFGNCIINIKRKINNIDLSGVGGGGRGGKYQAHDYNGPSGAGGGGGSGGEIKQIYNYILNQGQYNVNIGRGASSATLATETLIKNENNQTIFSADGGANGEDAKTASNPQPGSGGQKTGCKTGGKGGAQNSNGNDGTPGEKLFLKTIFNNSSQDTFFIGSGGGGGAGGTYVNENRYDYQTPGTTPPGDYGCGGVGGYNPSLGNTPSDGQSGIFVIRKQGKVGNNSILQDYYDLFDFSYKIKNNENEYIDGIYGEDFSYNYNEQESQILSFLTSGIFTPGPDFPSTIDIHAVGGGGGGGQNTGGGGGGGEAASNFKFNIALEPYVVNIGQGGQGGRFDVNADGKDIEKISSEEAMPQDGESSYLSKEASNTKIIEALGGKHGWPHKSGDGTDAYVINTYGSLYSTKQGGNGGSGGGGGSGSGYTGGKGGTNGGDGTKGTLYGGGASVVGTGKGKVLYDFEDTSLILRGGGGGGGSNSGTPGDGGEGGGGKGGSTSADSILGKPGTPHYGGGGGGGSNDSSTTVINGITMRGRGGDGGSGIVLIRPVGGQKIKTCYKIYKSGTFKPGNEIVKIENVKAWGINADGEINNRNNVLILNNKFQSSPLWNGCIFGVKQKIDFSKYNQLYLNIDEISGGSSGENGYYDFSNIKLMIATSNYISENISSINWGPDSNSEDAPPLTGIIKTIDLTGNTTETRNTPIQKFPISIADINQEGYIYISIASHSNPQIIKITDFYLI